MFLTSDFPKRPEILAETWGQNGTCRRHFSGGPLAESFRPGKPFAVSISQEMKQRPDKKVVVALALLVPLDFLDRRRFARKMDN
jgi:hypothetical protein